MLIRPIVYNFKTTTCQLSNYLPQCKYVEKEKHFINKTLHTSRFKQNKKYPEICNKLALSSHVNEHIIRGQPNNREKICCDSAIKERGKLLHMLLNPNKAGHFEIAFFIFFFRVDQIGRLLSSCFKKK